MKTKALFFFAFFLIIGFQSSAQTVIENEEVVEISNLKNLMFSDFRLDFYPKSGNYILIYRDYQYTMIDEYKSLNLGNKESILKLKNVILESLNKSEKEFEIGIDAEEGVTIIFRKILGQYKPYITDRGRLIAEGQVLNKKKIESLFPSEVFN